MKDKFRLKILEISGFRGFPTRQKFDLTQPFILLKGPNGTGKSSLLTAIEWCIYGDLVAKIKGTGIRERKNWAIVNKRANEARVSLTLESGEEMITLTRSSKGSFSMEMEDGTQIKERGRIWSNLGTELEDFFASIHLHQEAIRDLIISKPQKRRKAFYRLLGLSDIQNQLDAIRSGIEYLNRALKDKFTSPYMNLEARLETRWKDLNQRWKQKEKIGEEFGLSEEDFTHEKAENLAKKIENAIQKFGEEFELPLPADLGRINSVEKRGIFLKNLRQNIRRLRNENPSTTKLSKLRAKVAKLEGYKTTFQSLKKEKKSHQNQVEKLKQEKCPPKLKGEKEPQKLVERLEGVSKSIETKLKKTKEALLSSSVLAGLVADALQFVKTEESISFCPVCGQSTDKSKIMNHLAQKEREMGEKKRGLSDKISHLAEKLGELKNLKTELGDLIENLNRLSVRKEKGLMKLKEVFKLEVGPYEEPAKVIEKEISGINKKIEEIREVVTGLNEKLENFEDRAEVLQVIDGALKIRDKIEKLGSISQNPSLEKIREIRINAHRFGNELGILKQVLRNVLQKKASRKLNEAKKEIEAIFKKLTSRQDYPKLVVDPKDFEVWAKDKENGAPAATFYNQGDMNQAALSIFLGLAKQQNKSHRFELVILDDPSQSLGSDYKNSLAKLINNEVCKQSQVVVSTMDQEFVNALIENVVKKKSVLRFEGWSPVNGPKIVQES